MTLVRHNPKAANLFEDFFYNFPNAWGKDVHHANWSSVPTNIHETTDGYHVELSAPGRNKEDFKINIDNGLLTISFEEKQVEENNDYKTVRREFAFKSFKRSFTLDDKVNADAIQAKYDNGILKLFIPKKDEVKVEPKQISVQ
jgi:HSP20 family protein